MNKIKYLIFVFIIFIIQTTFIPYIKLFDIGPDLLLVFVAIFSIMSGRKRSILMGGFVGFLQDVFSSTVYVHTVSKIMIAIIIGFLKENILGGEESVSIVTVFIVSILAGVIDILFLTFFIGQAVPNIQYLLTIILVYSIYNCLFVPVLYPFVKSMRAE